MNPMPEEFAFEVVRRVYLLNTLAGERRHDARRSFRSVWCTTNEFCEPARHLVTNRAKCRKLLIGWIVEAMMNAPARARKYWA